MDLKMEVFSPELELLGMLESFQSVIWEEKAFTAGTFSIEALITENTLELVKEDNIIWIEGETAGIIEYISKSVGEDNVQILSVKGRLLSGILERRILWKRFNLDSGVAAIMGILVDRSAIHPELSPNGAVDPEARKIPGLVLGGPGQGDFTAKKVIHFERTGGSLLERLEELAETNNVAFGIRFNAAVPQMEFWAREGVDRSVNQEENDPVFYSTELDDVLTADYEYNAQGFKNIALVAGAGEGAMRIYGTVYNGELIDLDDPTNGHPGETEYATKQYVDDYVDSQIGEAIEDSY